MTPLGRRPRVGVALAPDRFVAMLPDGRVLETDDTGDLRQLFADLRSRSGLVRAVVDVALVPPLADIRILALPPLREEERRRVLERDARRHFVGLAQPVTIGTRVVGAQVLAAAAEGSFVAEIEQAVEADEWSLGVIVPVAAAWAAGVVRRWPERATGGGHVVAQLAQANEVLRLDAGSVVERRRFRTTDADKTQLARVIEESVAAGRVTTLAGPELEPLTFAARYAGAAAGPELVSPSRRTQRRRVVRRVVVAASIATAACLLLAAAVDYWGLARQLAALQARRTALQHQVGAALTARDSLGALATGLARLQQLEATDPRWSMFLADLADYLPRDAHLVSLRAVGDSVVVEGVATQAVGVFQAVQLMPGVAGVRAVAPIRQEVTADGTVREQFALGTLLHRSAQ